MLPWHNSSSTERQPRSWGGHVLTLWYKWGDTKCWFRERGWVRQRWRRCLFASKAKQKWKSQQCREPEWGSKILCWQNYWPQYYTQILERGEKKSHKASPGETERPGLHMQLHKCTRGSQEVWYKHIYLHTGLGWIVVATQLDVSTHARSLSLS